MKLTKLLLASLVVAPLIMAYSCTETAPRNLSLEVNPLIGTDGPGNVYPGAQVPFGLVQLSPDNGISGWDRIAGYFYPDTTIAGFSHTHLSGTGAGDLYDISFMPAIEPYKIATGELGLHSTFSHNDEKAWAGYYSVLLKDYDILVELTATEHCGIQKYTFNKGSKNALVKLDLNKAMNWDFPMGSTIEFVDSVTVQGWRFSEGWADDQKVFFTTKFSKPFTKLDLDTIYTKHSEPKYNNIANTVGRFYFDVKNGESIEVTTSISGVSINGSQLNYQAEAEGLNFAKLKELAELTWDYQLGKIKVSASTQAELTTFYTALYRTMLAPVLYSDIDGNYRGADGKIHKSQATTYSTFSLWDTYRAEHPLLTLLFPRRTEDMISSFLDFADQSGALPVWNMWSCETDMMIGIHSIPVIVEAYLKGLHIDNQKALKHMVASMERSDYRGLGDFNKIAFLPADKHLESVSKTLEYAYNAYCVSLMAAEMGERNIAQTFSQRSKAYLDVYNKESGFFQPKDINQQWLGGFDPAFYSHHFTESNAWHYRFLQHDIAQQIELMGAAQYEAALDSLFTVGPAPTDSLPIFSTGMIGQYAHGNEPSHHCAYLYNYVGKLEKTQMYVDSIRRSQYSDLPDGVCGNEDCGQMSAWYVFAAMGFYPVDPVSMRYELGIPLFDEMTIDVPAAKKFTIKKYTKNNRASTIKLNGQKLVEPYITWHQIKAGGVLEFFE